MPITKVEERRCSAASRVGEHCPVSSPAPAEFRRNVQLMFCSPYTLVGVDIKGEWNRPLLVNAAKVSGCSCAFALSDEAAKANEGPGRAKDDDLKGLVQGIQRIIACETTKNSIGLYDFPAPILRSVYAFGWRRVFLSDPHRNWFTEDPRVILAGRAAARRARNLLAVLPVEKLESAAYDAILVCDPDEPGGALSRLRLPECRRLLVVLGSGEALAGVDMPATPVMVDFVDRSVPARTRHTGSILLSVIAGMLET